VRGFALEGEASEEEAARAAFRERPQGAEQLLTGGGAPARLVQLAALAESLDYIANAIIRIAGGNSRRWVRVEAVGPGGVAASTPRS
jgi:hypothetical protein